MTSEWTGDEDEQYEAEIKAYSDDDLISAIYNCDAADQDAQASALFIELIERYENKKDECEELRNAHNSVLEELNNKKKECEELESEVAAYRDQTGD